MTVTIKETYKLPSLGKLYKKPFDPTVELRSMTVAEEMKRLSPSNTPYKVMSEIIEDCLLTKLPFSVYDLCMADYTYLLHKLRVVTYGPDYTIQIACPKCGEIQKVTINLDELKVKEYKDDISKNMVIQLPVTGKSVKLRLQTPRDLDTINLKREQMKKDFPDMKGDPSILLTLESLIETVDGEPVNQITLREALKQLPMRDTNMIIRKATQLQEKVGIDTIVNTKCEKCGSDVKTTFRYTGEFFGPTND